MNTDQRSQLMLDAAQLIRSLADVVEAIANTYKDISIADSEAKVIEAEEVKVLPQVTLEDVRAVLAVKSQNGLTAEVRELIKKYGGTKLSDIDPTHYAELKKDAEELGNE